MESLKIKVGCIYLNHLGYEVPIVDYVDSNTRPRLYKLGYRFIDNDGEVYSSTGRFNVFEKSKYDLIGLKSEKRTRSLWVRIFKGKDKT
jgi:hypothetical protein